MGCAGSKKLEDEEAVRHCLDRTRLLADAIRLRYALAASQAAYSGSLLSVGAALQKFILPSGHPHSSPVLPLPTQRKGDHLPPLTPSPPPPLSASAAAAPGHSHSHSHSGSHIQFHSSDDSDGDSDEMSPFHSDTSSPIHLRPDDAPVDDRNQPPPLSVHHNYAHNQPPPPSVHHNYARNQPPPPSVHLNYARNQPPPPSFSYEQRPQNPERVQFGYEPQISASGYDYPNPPESSNSYYSYPAQSSNPYPFPSQSSNAYPFPAQSSNAYPYPAQSSNFNPYPDPYMSYGGGGMGGGYHGFSLQPPNLSMPGMAADGSNFPSTSQTSPPPPPSPPRASTWDFLNPFELYDNYYNAHTPSRSSKELREEEGIPDLEDEENEVVKEAYGDRKSVSSISSASLSTEEHSSKPPMTGKEAETSNVAEDANTKSRSVEESTSRSKHDIDVVEKRVVTETPDDIRGMAGFATPRRSYHDITEVVHEIKSQFDKASESADHVSKMLEVGKLPYQQKNSFSKVSARMVCGLPYPSTFKNKELLIFEEDKAMGSGNLSSTLEKLYTWEKKLLEEVKVEEETRQIYDRKREQLRHLIDKGAEAEKIEAVQTNIKKLSTKIRIAIQIVQSISSNINKLRDDELWPQISELIQGFMQMWRLMAECHHIQYQAISEATNIDSIISGLKHSEDHTETIKKLEMELLTWMANFSSWISTQKNYVKCLNEWLIKCLHYVPEETDDGVPPFSPGRLGAPPVFVICNYWSQSMDRILEKDVIYAMQAFADNVMQIWEQHRLEQRQSLMANSDNDKKLRVIERDEQVMQKAVEAHKKLTLVPAQATETGSLHSSLKLTFEAMDNFTVNTVRTYEELNARCEEEKGRFSRENKNVP